MATSNQSFRISPRELELVRNHAQRDYPCEACGFLIGESTGGNTRVTSIVPVPNTAAPETRGRAYAISPQAWMSVEKQVDSLHHVIVGIYHSHPDHDAVISRTDAEALWPELVYLIIPAGSMRHQPPVAWRLDADTGLIRSCPLEVAP